MICKHCNKPIKKINIYWYDKDYYTTCTGKQPFLHEPIGREENIKKVLDKMEPFQPVIR